MSDATPVEAWFIDNSAVSAVRLLPSTAVVEAAEVLRAGGLLGLPTETVYGLAADAEDATAVARIYEVKGRPNDHPVIVHVAAASAIEEWAVAIPAYARELAVAFWPGPMTLVLPRSSRAGDFITGGQDTVGLRVPNHPVALAVLAAFGGGVAAPSANRFGEVSPTSAGEVVADLSDRLGAGDAVIDGGRCAVGVESTIVDCTGAAPAILRPGAVTIADIERVTGLPVVSGGAVVRAPGTLASHYAPRATVWLADSAAEVQRLASAHPGAGLIADAAVPTPAGLQRLAAVESVADYARELYRALRAADEQGLVSVIALPPVGVDLAFAVRDRLTRAAHK